MTYNILPYTRRRAKKLGLEVRPSHNKTKKIDVFKKHGSRKNAQDDEKGRIQRRSPLASVGAIGYMDYPTYIKKKGLKYAKERRRLYRIRHQKDRHIKGTPGWYADKLLW